MENPNLLEQSLLKALVFKYPELESHLPLLKVATRKISDSSSDTTLVYENNPILINEELNALFSDGKIIQIPELKKGLSYVIDITCGEITSIELNTYEEKWNGKMSAFELVEVER